MLSHSVFNILVKPFHLTIITHIQPMQSQIFAGGGKKCGGCLFTAAIDAENPDPLCQKGLTDRPANTPGGAGDHRFLSLQAVHTIYLPLHPLS